MKARVIVRELHTGRILEGQLSTEHAASGYGRPVLLVGGEIVHWPLYEIVGNPQIEGP